VLSLLFLALGLLIFITLVVGMPDYGAEKTAVFGIPSSVAICLLLSCLLLLPINITLSILNRSNPKEKVSKLIEKPLLKMIYFAVVAVTVILISGVIFIVNPY
jgi:hypothetical protein